MSLADKLVSSFLAFELDINVQSPVHYIRTEAIKEFEKLGFILFSSKPKQETIKPKKERNAKTNKPAKKEKKETKVVKKTTKKIVNKEENN